MQMFTLVYVLKPPGVVTVVTGSYTAAWSSQAFGIGSAIALLLLLALVVLRWPQVRIVRRQNA
jgi:ABC-type sugar transport system permease subunit